MKINNINNQYQKITQYNKSKENLQKTENIKQEKSVNVEISKSAKELAEKINENKDVNFSGRVEKIRASVLDGTYKIDSGKIAEKIIEKIESQKGSED